MVRRQGLPYIAPRVPYPALKHADEPGVQDNNAAQSPAARKTQFLESLIKWAEKKRCMRSL